MNLEYIYSDENNPTMVIVWDLGRRCNYDCTYCTAWMHSTTAPLNNIEKFKKTAKFIDKYYTLYAKHHRKNWSLTISFTGGEPAVNPAFYELLPYLKENYPYMKLNLTTNGTWNERKGKFLLEHLNSITVSYHCEGTEKQKKLVKDNLFWLRNEISNPSKLKVNVMMHQDYFDECVDLIENFLKPNDIRYTPRIIGDDAKFKSKWFTDMDGALRRTSHTYEQNQLDYLKNHWNDKNKEAANTTQIKKIEFIRDKKEINQIFSKESVSIEHKKNENYQPTNEKVENFKTDEIKAVEIKTEVKDGLARKMGRMCCGKRTMTAKIDGEIKNAAFIEQSNFKGYNCMINWFFLHIEEDKNAVYHHQTCMAKLPNSPAVDIDMVKFTKTNFTNEVGPITSLDKTDEYLEWLETQFENDRTPTVICPNTYCGCGICVTKANNEEDFRVIADKFIKLGTLI